MAGPSQLLRSISDITGILMPTLVDIDRRLVSAGMRAKGGRGFNVARMSPTDASILLTAVLTHPQANQSAEAVKRYANTHIQQDRSSEGGFGLSGVKELIALKPQNNFVDAMAALITAYMPGGSLASKAGVRAGMPKIDVHASTRSTHGLVRLTALPKGRVVSVEYRSSAKAKAALAGDLKNHDLEEIRLVTERTIQAIAKSLSEERSHD